MKLQLEKEPENAQNASCIRLSGSDRFLS